VFYYHQSIIKKVGFVKALFRCQKSALIDFPEKQNTRLRLGLSTFPSCSQYGRCVLSHGFGFFICCIMSPIMDWFIEFCQALPITGMTCDQVFLLFPFRFCLRSATRISISSSTRFSEHLQSILFIFLANQICPQTVGTTFSPTSKFFHQTM